MTEGKFGTQEAVWLTVCTIVAKVFFTSPSLVTSILGTSGWYMTLISAAVAAGGFWLTVKLLNRFPNMSLSEVYMRSLGRVAGFAFSLILGIYLLFVASLNIGEFQEVLRVYVFPNTPNGVIILIFAGSVLLMSLLGLESIARISKIIAFFTVAGFLAVLILSVENYEVSNLFPILGYGLDKTIINGVLRCSVYGDVIILAIFAKSLQGIQYVKRAGFIALLLSALLIFLCLLAFALCFPYYVSKEITSAMYEIATIIDYGRFVQRIEPVFLFIWVTTSMLASTTLFYSFVRLYCDAFRIYDWKPIAVAGSVILFALSLMHRDISEIAFAGVQLTRMIGIIPMFIMPVIALFIAVIRKKGGNEVA